MQAACRQMAPSTPLDVLLAFSSIQVLPAANSCQSHDAWSRLSCTLSKESSIELELGFQAARVRRCQDPLA